jgi:vancomycin permeability regulator SanA
VGESIGAQGGTAAADRIDTTGSHRPSGRHRWRRPLRIIRTTLILVALLYLLSAVAIVGYGLQDTSARADLVVVPGNTVSPDGTPSSRLRARLDVALRLYREHQVSAVLVSGAVGKEGVDESVVMARYLTERGVPAAAVIQDGDGSTTAATAEHTATVLDQHHLTSVIVATQYFHVARTELALRQRQVHVVGAVHARFVEPRDLYSALREVPAVVRYLIIPG